MPAYQEILRVKKWPCNFFPCARTILSGDSAWKTNHLFTLVHYFKYQMVFEIAFAFKSIKRRLP